MDFKIATREVQRWAAEIVERDRKKVGSFGDVLEAVLRKLLVSTDSEELLTEASKQRWNLRKFRSLFGRWPIGYLRNLRLTVGQRALETWSDDEGDVGDVAVLTGHQSAQAFSKSFKGRFGMPPGMYRGEVWARRTNLTQRCAETGLSLHEFGRDLLRQGKESEAFQVLLEATGMYTRAGDLPKDIILRQRNVGLDYDPRQALLSEMCPECLTLLESDKGEPLRDCLANALGWMDPDLAWSQGCCGECYRVVHQARTSAIISMTGDAWKSYWLLRNASLDNGFPSIGRFIWLILEADKFPAITIKEGWKLATGAFDEAERLGDNSLVAVARNWLGFFLREKGEFDKARVQLNYDVPAGHGSRWLLAHQATMLGRLEYDLSRYENAREFYEIARSIYNGLDEHLVGRNLILTGAVEFYLKNFVQAISYYEEAREYLDGRRDPEVVMSMLPVTLAAALALDGRLDQAADQLRGCEFDRRVHRVWAAKELFTRACIEMLRREYYKGSILLNEAIGLFKKEERLLDCALALSYLSEAYVRLDMRPRAIDAVNKAIEIFSSIECSVDVLHASRKLAGILVGGSVKEREIVELVRHIGQAQGGWLPEPVGEPLA